MPCLESMLILEGRFFWKRVFEKIIRCLKRTYLADHWICKYPQHTDDLRKVRKWHQKAQRVHNTNLKSISHFLALIR